MERVREAMQEKHFNGITDFSDWEMNKSRFWFTLGGS